MAFDPNRKAFNSTLRPRSAKKANAVPDTRKKRKPLKANRKNHGEVDAGERLYHLQGGVSALSGLPLLPPGHPQFHCQVSHILPKGSYGRIRAYLPNLMIVTYDEHRQWEHNRDPDILIGLDPRWRKWIEWRDQLRLEYNTNPNFPTDGQQEYPFHLLAARGQG